MTPHDLNILVEREIFGMDCSDTALHQAWTLSKHFGYVGSKEYREEYAFRDFYHDRTLLGVLFDGCTKKHMGLRLWVEGNSSCARVTLGEARHQLVCKETPLRRPL